MNLKNRRESLKRVATVADVAKAIRSHHSFLLCAHVKPEGDSVGSLLALRSLLRKLGKRSWIVNENAFPKRLDVMFQDGWYTVQKFKQIRDMPKFDACIIVDCPHLERIGDAARFIHPGMAVVNIDHHVTNGRFGDLDLVDERAASCGEIVYDLFKHMKVPLTKKEAVPLYVSLTTDTGSFRFSNTSSKTHRVVAELIEKGIDLEKVNDAIYARFSHGRTKLLADLLRDIKVELGGRLVWSVMPLSMFRKRKATFEDAEGFIDSLRFIKDVCIAFLVIESERNVWQVSFRAKGPYDVSRIAEVFGGGGHRKAAGCTFYGSCADAVEKVRKEARSYLTR